MTPAPDRSPGAAEALATEVVGLVRTVLGPALVGAYLHGSMVEGGLRATSDVDVLAVVDRTTTLVERRSIIDGLLEISGRRARRGPARPVELTLVVLPDVVPWRYPPPMELQYGEWLRDAFEAGDVPDPAPNPDLAPLLAAARANGRALVGPEPASILAPVPVADLRRAGADSVAGLLADLDGDTRNVLLTLARIAFTLETGELASKDAAAAWAARRLPARHRGALNLARELYLAGHDPDHWGDDLPAARAAADHLAATIRDATVADAREIRPAAADEHTDTSREG